MNQALGTGKTVQFARVSPGSDVIVNDLRLGGVGGDHYPTNTHLPVEAILELPQRTMATLGVSLYRYST